MELSILDVAGLPEGSILSVRSGPTRRQSPLPCTAPFRLPAGPWPLRIDALALLGKSIPGSNLGQLDAGGCCKVPLEARDGRSMSVTLQVLEGKAAGLRPKTAPNAPVKKDLEEPEAETSPAQPVRRRDTEAEARSYLDRHRLHEFMHALFELLLRERPVDPYSFIAARFREAARLEPQSAPAELPAVVDGLAKVTPPKLQSVGAMMAPEVPPPTQLVQQEPPSQAVPEGALQMTIRNMRGRSLAKLTAHPTEKVSGIKKRLESGLGPPANSQQLLWWSETLPNDTTLGDHGIPAGASLHLVCSTKEPRLRYTLSGSSDGGLKLWNLENGEMVKDFAGTSSCIIAVSVEWSSMRALSGAFNGYLHLWDLRTGVVEPPLEGHSDEVNTLDVDWPSMRALSGSGDGTAKLWKLDERKVLATMQGGSGVCALAADWPRMRAVGGLRNGLVRLWDLAQGTTLRDFSVGGAAADAAGTAVSACAIDVAGGRAVSGLEDGHLAYWHFGGGDEAPGQGTAGEASSAATPVPAASAAAAADKASNAPAPTTRMLLAHYSAVRTIVAKWSDTGSRALCGSDDGSLSLWRLDSQECMARFARHVGMVWTVFADWGRDRAVSGAFDGCVKLWDLRTGEPLRTLQAHSRPVRSIAAGWSS